MAYNDQEATDFFRVFAAFEGAVSAVAAERRTPADSADLHAVHERIGVLRSSKGASTKAGGYRRLNRDFHGVIHSISRSGLVTDMSVRLWDMSDFLIYTAGAPDPLGAALCSRHSEHQEILDAIVEGDSAKARAATETHVLGILAVISSSSGNLVTTPA